MYLLGKSRIRQKYYLSAFDNPTKQVMVNLQFFNQGNYINDDLRSVIV